MSDETLAAFDEFQRELSTDYLSNPEYAMRLTRSYIDKHPVFHFIDGIGTPLYVNNECAERASPPFKSPNMVESARTQAVRSKIQLS
ncbi:hypothetical protein [Aeromonas sp. R4-2]|uniref:hypothetical protein n=1 Tax=Aeromonas sp. R4-2 TaxID=3138465 RepID=UPI002086FDBA|nr:hypothetical protein VCSRO69_3594 [Vibrio cholerae]GIB53496.1 hypothetical protein VCSRO187_3565 [Vibrio cholerae]